MNCLLFQITHFLTDLCNEIGVILVFEYCMRSIVIIVNLHLLYLSLILYVILALT